MARRESLYIAIKIWYGVNTSPPKYTVKGKDPSLFILSNMDSYCFTKFKYFSSCSLSRSVGDEYPGRGEPKSNSTRKVLDTKLFIVSVLSVKKYIWLERAKNMLSSKFVILSALPSKVTVPSGFVVANKIGIRDCGTKQADGD